MISLIPILLSVSPNPPPAPEPTVFHFLGTSQSRYHSDQDSNLELCEQLNRLFRLILTKTKLRLFVTIVFGNLLFQKTVNQK